MRVFAKYFYPLVNRRWMRWLVTRWRWWGLEGRKLGPELDKAAQLLATVVGQDLDQDGDGVFRIARRVAKDRVISSVDPQSGARAQDLRARVRRLQGPPRRRPGFGDCVAVILPVWHDPPHAVANGR
jgi:hypothetical protein